MDIITAKILTITPHPQAGRLKICQVSDGKNNFSIVCGAKNAREGMLTILAPVGSTTPKGQKIQISELRGVTSQGMLCSAKDLAISQEEGLIDLPADTELGRPYTEISQIYLSSIPWHQFDEVESFWYQPEQKNFIIQRNNPTYLPTSSEVLVSKTYFDGASYRYRHFSWD